MSGWEPFALVALAALAGFWMDTLKARERCLTAVRRACTDEGFQLLDETVMVERLRLARNDAGHLAIQRHYVFEYSMDGTDRASGRMSLLGADVEMIDLRRRPHLVLVRNSADESLE